MTPVRQARLLLGVLLLLALVSLGLQPGRRHSLPEDDGLAEVARAIEADARPGDAVAVLPAWADALRVQLPDGIALHALPADDAVLLDAPRLWVASFPRVPGAEVDEAVERLAARRGAPTVDRSFEPVRLLRFDAGARPRQRFSDRLAAATVQLGPRPCLWRPESRRPARFQCPRGDWNYVAAETRELDYLPRRCLWAHPVKGAPLTITWTGLTLPEQLEVRGGIIGELALLSGAGEVHLEVRVDGDPVGTLVVPPAPGFHGVTLPLTAREGTLSFVVTAENDGRRHFCFDAWGVAPEARP